MAAIGKRTRERKRITEKNQTKQINLHIPKTLYYNKNLKSIVKYVVREYGTRESEFRKSF